MCDLLSAKKPGEQSKWPDITKVLAQRFFKVPLDDVPFTAPSAARLWLRRLYAELA
jgi:hypothetical protein